MLKAKNKNKNTKEERHIIVNWPEEYYIQYKVQ